jgi:two-component system chemotaxis response regulator CheY
MEFADYSVMPPSLEVTCPWCRRALGSAAPQGEPSRGLRVCAACRQRRRLEWAARRRASVRLRADSEQRKEESRIRLARARASLTGAWARLLAAWQAHPGTTPWPPGPGAPSPPTAPSTVSPAGAGTRRRLTVLIIEDDPHIRDASRLLLEDLGARVLTAVDGLGGLALLEVETPDVVLCDLRMPRLDGFGFIRRVRQDPRWARLPVVAASAFENNAEQERMREVGFDGTLGKPFDLAGLAGLVERLAHRRLAA